MSRRALLQVLGLILLACAAALTVLPARWAMAMLPAAWPLAVIDASGTIWSGRATVAFGTPERRRSLPDPLRWQVSFRGGPKVLVTHPWLGGPLTLTPAWRGIGVSAQTLHLPAAALAALDARLELIGPGGELLFKWPATFIGRASRSAGAPVLDVQWRNAASTLTPIRPLGDYALALTQGSPGRIELALTTRQGPLQLNGTGMLDGKSGAQFDGTAQADPAASADTQAALSDLLAALGPRRNSHTLLRFR